MTSPKSLLAAIDSDLAISGEHSDLESMRTYYKGAEYLRSASTQAEFDANYAELMIRFQTLAMLGRRILVQSGDERFTA